MEQDGLIVQRKFVNVNRPNLLRKMSNSSSYLPHAVAATAQAMTGTQNCTKAAKPPNRPAIQNTIAE